jgi:SAM-dependent methyltransferase
MAPLMELERVLKADGLNLPSLAGCRDIDAVLERCGARYMTHGLDSLRDIESASVDFVFSNAVLEHIRRHEFTETMRELRRILKPAGIGSHQVDLSDHLGGALNNLRFSATVWEGRLFAMSGFYTNRIGHSQMLEIFNQAGFDATTTRIDRWPSLPTPKQRMAPEFRGIADEELCIRGFHVLLR